MGLIRDKLAEADLPRRGWSVDCCYGDGGGGGSSLLREAFDNLAEEEGGEEYIQEIIGRVDIQEVIDEVLPGMLQRCFLTGLRKDKVLGYR